MTPTAALLRGGALAQQAQGRGEALVAAVDKVMNAPHSQPLFSAATVLAGLAKVYGGLAALRADLHRFGVLSSRRLPCAVVSVGNLTVGGTGKTPLAMDIAGRLQAMGWRVCVLSRGYRGKAEHRGAVVSDGRRILVSADEAGDEPHLIARRLDGVPVLVGRDRWAAGMTAVERFGAQVAVLDDGYQHLTLARDANLLLLDALNPLGNGWTLPRGRLRETPRASRRADALIFVSRGADFEASCGGWDPAPGRPRLAVRLLPHAAAVFIDGRKQLDAASAAAYLEDRRCVAFAGIADNERFFSDVVGLKARLAAGFSFADHHPYHAEDMARITAAAHRAGAACLVTTAKDHVRLSAGPPPDLPLVVVDLKVVWSDGGAGIGRLLENLLGRPPAALHRRISTLP